MKKRIFIHKWVDHLLLISSYLVIIVTDSHQTCVKMCLRDMRTATENGKIALEKNKEKPYGGGGFNLPSLYYTSEGKVLLSACQISQCFCSVCVFRPLFYEWWVAWKWPMLLRSASECVRLTRTVRIGRINSSLVEATSDWKKPQNVI